MKKITTIVGARPQFIKAAAISRKLRKYFSERLIHTGQHYAPEMSEYLIDELKLPRPDLNLHIGSLPHGAQTGRILEKIEQDLIDNRPDLLLVYGDTNSTLAGALAAAKLHIPIAHIEAGLRSNNRKMPEEINRILTDHISSLLFVPSIRCEKILNKEGIKKGIVISGDIMLDMVLLFLPRAKKRVKDLLHNLKIDRDEYYYFTLHRSENTTSEKSLIKALSLLSSLDKKTIFAMHPRTHFLVEKYRLYHLINKANIIILPPQPYTDNLALQLGSKTVITDSGGMQKEAFWLGKKCITLREDTEWDETVKEGYNFLTGLDKDKLEMAIMSALPDNAPYPHYGSGNASDKIIKSIAHFLEAK